MGDKKVVGVFCAFSPLHYCFNVVLLCWKMLLPIDTIDEKADDSKSDLSEKVDASHSMEYYFRRCSLGNYQFLKNHKLRLTGCN
jgi:hypothetical protein